MEEKKTPMVVEHTIGVFLAWTRTLQMPYQHTTCPRIEPSPGVSCKLSIAVMVFTFVIAAALLAFGARVGNWILIGGSALGYSLIFVVFLLACLNGRA